jgi:protein TonB
MAAVSLPAGPLKPVKSTPIRRPVGLRIPRLSVAELLAEPPPARDRLGLSLTVAILLHALIILGVSFVPSEPASKPEESLDVILVQERSEKPPGKADFLAQAAADGGGDAKTKERPGAPLPSPIPGNKAELALSGPEAAPAPAPAPAPPARAAAAQPGPSEPVLAKERDSAPIAAPESKAEKSAKPAKAAKPAQDTQAELAEAAPAPTSQPQQATPTAAQLLDSSFAIASLNAEIRDRLVNQARGPRRKFVTSMTREYKYAAYMEAWRSKVERIGNLNYPEDARRLGLSGSLILDVAVQTDGSIEDIAVRRSSGEPILDQAAIRIVKLASPFAKFPEDIKSETDVLHITRTWQFLNSNTFSSDGG